MLLDLSGPPANPSSPHFFGRQARSLLADARAVVASYFGAKPEEIIFTSGGTEGINFLLRGLPPKGHLITTSIEHSSTYRTVQALEAKGLAVTYLPVGPWGAPQTSQIEAALRPDTCAIILSAANSETGVKIDLDAIASLAERRRIPLLIDAVAFIGKEPFIPHRGIAALICGAHKFHGPKGVGAIYLRSDLTLPPLLTGGNQESMRRAGTSNLAGILGMAKAIELLQESQPHITAALHELRDRFEQGLKSAIPDILINGEGPRVAGTSNISFPGLDGETLLMQLDLAGIAASQASTCSAGASEPSRVLLNMGFDRRHARSSLRFSFSRMNTLQEVDLAIERIHSIVTQLRQLRCGRCF
jgi:cysteine desulfurase